MVPPKYFFMAVFFLLAPLATLAKEPAGVYLPSGSSIDGNYYAAGESVEIAGAVSSDVIAAGGNVIITGAVGGDVIAAGGNVRIIGPVAGNIRALGGNVEIVGTVAKNVTVGAGTLIIAESARIAGHVTVGAGSLEVRGKIGGELLAASGVVILAGEVTGPVKLFLDKSGSLDVRETAKTSNSFAYYGGESVNIVNGAQLAQPPVQHTLPTRGVKSVWWWHLLVSLFSALALGMVLVSLIPQKIEEVMSEALANPWRALGWGVLWAVTVPIISVGLLITVIGWPLTVLLLTIYIFGLIVAPVLAGATFGWYLKSRAGEGWFSKQSLMLVVLLGIVIYRLVLSVPIIGGLLSLLGTLLAWGAMLQVQRRIIKSFR